MSAYIGTRIVAHTRPAVGGETGPRAEMIRSSYQGMVAACRRKGDRDDELARISSAVSVHVRRLRLPPSPWWPKSADKVRADKRAAKEAGKRAAKRGAR